MSGSVDVYVNGDGPFLKKENGEVEGFGERSVLGKREERDLKRIYGGGDRPERTGDCEPTLRWAPEGLVSSVPTQTSKWTQSVSRVTPCVRAIYALTIHLLIRLPANDP